MFITRATRHDKADIKAMLDAQSWETSLDEGVTFFARDGAVVGCVRLVEVEPQSVIVDDVVVAKDRRGEGIGPRVITAAMNSRGGMLYLSCHEELIGFYEKLGFALTEKDAMPESVKHYFDRAGDLNPPPGHVHFFMRAR